MLDDVSLTDVVEGFTKRRVELVRRAVKEWTAALIDLGGRNNLLRYRDLKGRLTRRQREVLEHVAAGRTNGEVAWLLGISPETVRKHLKNSYEKLGVHTRTGAVAAVFEHRGSLDSPPNWRG